MHGPGPMTLERSRWLGRALIAWAGVSSLLAVAMVRARWWLLPVALVTLAGAGLLAWIGVTLAVMDWDDPADWPPSATPEG